MYWEGDCPEWIRACQSTVFRHAGNVRLLSADDFYELWDVDRDIDLERLQIAQRADFVRALLLARYGGLWIDSDCLVMRPLDAVIRALADYDFVAHRERSGFFSNGFIGARPDSEIASAFYKMVCAILRSPRPLTWSSLGAKPLNAILRTTTASWHEIERELIQPICWSKPGAFFAKGTPQAHERAVNQRALCYMLSNTRVRAFQAVRPSMSLLDDGTFFRHLLGRATQAAG